MNPDFLFILYCILGAIVAFEVGIHVVSVFLIVPIFERKLPFEVKAVDPEPSAERLTTPTSDGLTLRGALYSPETEPLGVVIFCPEFKGNHWTALEYCSGLVRSGFAVLAFDFRGQGESDAMPGYEPLHWCTDHEVRDLESVVRFARSHSLLAGLPMGFMGISRGGNAALTVAAADEDVQCVVVDGAYTTDTLMALYAVRWTKYYKWILLPEWHLRISCQLARFVSEVRRKVHHPSLDRLLPSLRRRDVLLIAGQRDSYVPPESSKRIQRRIGGDSKVWYVTGAKHNRARQTKPQEYDKRVVDQFLNMAPVIQFPPTISTPKSASVGWSNVRIT